MDLGVKNHKELVYFDNGSRNNSLQKVCPNYYVGKTNRFRLLQNCNNKLHIQTQMQYNLQY